jgi:Cytochrome c554 and c-prime
MNRALKIAIVLALAANLGAEPRGPIQVGAGGAQSAQATKADQHGRNGYVGDEACLRCHASIVDSFHKTTHYLTSSEPSETSILGKCTPGNNILKTANPGLYFKMDERRTADGKTAFFQTAVEGDPPDAKTQTERIAFVIGSGKKGQTYLYWDKDQLFELPASYWKDIGWVNSPGYIDGIADFKRVIIPRCLECHASYFKTLSPPVNRYSTVGYSVGIHCEVCHGPGQKHVELEESQSATPGASGILNPEHFSRKQQMDLCSWCHAGLGQLLRPAFSYRPGEVLSQYLYTQQPDPYAPPNLHGNQVALLEMSQCFRSSNMTCLTCHDVHVTQHSLAYFSSKCLSCHKPDSATFARADHPVTNNCIDCHMPKQESNKIVFNSNGKIMRPQFRNHWIKVYPATQALLVQK